MKTPQTVKCVCLLCSVLLPTLLPAQMNSPSATGDGPSDDALQSYLAQSDLVVVAENLSNNGRYNLRERFRVDSTIKGDPRTNIITVNDSRGWPGPNVEYPDGKMVLFLWTDQASGQTNLANVLETQRRELRSDAGDPCLVGIAKKAGGCRKTNSGGNQFKALMRKFVPNWTIRELKYTIGNKTYSTAELVEQGTLLDRRELKWVAVSAGPPSNNITYMHCPKLTSALWESSNVQTAQDAEDYVRLIIGLCAGPRALELWKFKAQPYGDSWLVTPTYVGRRAQVRSVGPIELVFINRASGKVADVREWRPNFVPGKTAKIMRPTGMNPDGLDSSPGGIG